MLAYETTKPAGIRNAKNSSPPAKNGNARTALNRCHKGDNCQDCQSEETHQSDDRKENEFHTNNPTPCSGPQSESITVRESGSGIRKNSDLSRVQSEVLRLITPLPGPSPG